jgi:hypothetical protein
MLENQFIYPIPKGSKLILTASSSSRQVGTRFFAPLGAGLNEENQFETIKGVIVPGGYVKIKLNS